jgi:hypothetical protein
MRDKNEDELRLTLIRLAKQYGGYGSRKIGQLLRIEGWCVNHNKVERIWREEGLQLTKRLRRASGITTMMLLSSSFGQMPTTTYGRSTAFPTS